MCDGNVLMFWSVVLQKHDQQAVKRPTSGFRLSLCKNRQTMMEPEPRTLQTEHRLLQTDVHSSVLSSVSSFLPSALVTVTCETLTDLSTAMTSWIHLTATYTCTQQTPGQHDITFKHCAHVEFQSKGK